MTGIVTVGAGEAKKRREAKKRSEKEEKRGEP
jgi:hypothetical protein